MGSSSAPTTIRFIPFFITTLFFFLLSFFTSFTFSGPISIPSIRPTFTVSYLGFIDNVGVFLASQNRTFQASITNNSPESDSFYLVVIHVSSHTVVWSANRNNPVSRSSELRFTNRGLILYNDTGYPVWSTPRNLSSVSSLQLLDSGNLVLLDSSNNSVWESFDFPTDTLVPGQKLKAGNSLVSSVSNDDFSEGGNELLVGNSDAILQWDGLDYWRLSMERRAFRNSNFPVEFLVMNSTGLFLMGQNGRQIVVSITLSDPNNGLPNSSDFRIVKLDHNGVFNVVKINTLDGSQEQVFRGPDDNCRIPSICGSLEVCTNGGSCQCPPAFHVDPRSNGGDCVPMRSSLTFSGPCNASSSSNYTNINYLSLRNDIDYFSNDFTDPSMRGVTLSVCRATCSTNCSCGGFFYSQDTGFCYLISDNFGSMFVKSSTNRGNANRLGYVKTIELEDPNDASASKSDFPLLAEVLLPSSGVLVIIVVATAIWLRRKRRRRSRLAAKRKLGRDDSYSSAEEEIDFVTIPGLPVRFDYLEIAAATEQFKTQIGSGGFGTVYKGTLVDGADVAVKKITCLGAQGKKEFLTEIAVIGKIHHVNLVKLKGFCAHAGQRFLVYEYMNRGSLAHTLFSDRAVLRWQERYEIALGTARGLAYLHSGCEHKIIHCDVKPENILLDDKSQVKISDFGLSKLLSPEQSGLFTTMRGTRGYLAPEWLTSSAISDKTDVYSYGMVLLEIVRGKKNSCPQARSHNSSTATDRSNNSSSSPGEVPVQRLIYFPLYALEMHEERRYLELVDQRLMGQVRSEDVEKLVRVALCCVQEEPNLRPSMSNVVGMLEGGVALGEPRLESLNFLRFYGRRFTEASTLGEENEMIMLRQQTSSTASSYNSFSYLSSQQVSGPR